jgi:hypothetical protein
MDSVPWWQWVIAVIGFAELMGQLLEEAELWMRP